jgi:hypothetical protein
MRVALAALIGISLLITAQQITQKSSKSTSTVSDQTALENVYGQSIEATWQSQDVGDIVVGTILSEKDGLLIVDGNPCHNKKHIFTTPYSTDLTGRTIQCGNESFQEARVKQEAPEQPTQHWHK